MITALGLGSLRYGGKEDKLIYSEPKTFKEQMLNFVARISTEMRVLLNTIKTPFKGASATSSGALGAVPAPVAGDEDNVLHGDGSWKVVSHAIRAESASSADRVDVSAVVNLNVGAKNFTGSASGLTVTASRDTYGRLTGVALSGVNTQYCTHCTYCESSNCSSSNCDCGDDQS